MIKPSVYVNVMPATTTPAVWQMTTASPATTAIPVPTFISNRCASTTSNAFIVNNNFINSSIFLGNGFVFHNELNDSSNVSVVTLICQDGILTLDDSTFSFLKEIKLPDGATILFDPKRKRFTINTKDAKYTYKSKGTLEYNPFIETHDVLEKFIKYLGTKNVSKKDFMNMPMHIFLKWLVIESAKTDGEDVNENEMLQLEHDISQK